MRATGLSHNAAAQLLRSIVAGTVLAAILGLLLLFVIPRAMGGAVLAVTSGSMTPAIPVGSLVVVLPAEDRAIEVGDIVTFQRAESNGEFVTHRVVRVIDDATQTVFATKGDANLGEDRELVRPSDIVGEVALTLPFLGSAAELIRSPLGLGIVGGIVGIGALSTLLSRRPRSSPTATPRRNADSDYSGVR